MATAITYIHREAPGRDELNQEGMQEIIDMAVKNKDALLLLLELAQDLKQAGLLEIAHAFIQNRDRIAEIGIGQLNKSGAQNIIKNGMGAIQLLSSLEPGKMQQVLGAITAGMDESVKQEGAKERTGLWAMLKALKEPEIKASFRFMISFARGMGKYLLKQPR